VGQLLKGRWKRLEDTWLISESLYAAHGGYFPVIIKGTGVISAITVSSFAQEDDHQLVIQAIREYLKHQI